MRLISSFRRHTKKLVLLYLFLVILYFYREEIFLHLKREPLWASFISRRALRPTNETITILDHLRNQLERVAITREGIEYARKLPFEQKCRLLLCFVQIIDGKIYIDQSACGGYNIQVLRNALHYLVKNSKIKIPNVEFVFSGHDLNGEGEEWNQLIAQVPLIMMSKNKAKENVLLIPDSYMLEKRGYSFQLTLIKIASRFYGWKKKKEKVFWRGATSGTYVGENDSIEDVIKRGPRYKLVNLSLSNQDIDAKFSSYVQIDYRKRNQMIEYFGGVDGQTVITHLSSKYLISIDGNGCAWRRVPWILYSNSVLFKQESNLVEWFYPALKAFVHYVPIKEDLSDLEEKIEWCKQNDELANKISKEGSKFVEENLMPQQVLDHLGYFLVEYSKKQQFVLSKPDYDLSAPANYDLW